MRFQPTSSIVSCESNPSSDGKEPVKLLRARNLRERESAREKANGHMCTSVSSAPVRAELTVHFTSIEAAVAQSCV